MEDILFHCTQEDVSYLPRLKPLIAGKARVHLNNDYPQMSIEIAVKAQQKGASKIITTSEKLLSLLMDNYKRPTIDNYAGSIFHKHNCQFLILDPVEHLITVPYGKFLYERYLSKFLEPSRWMQIPDFSWELFSPEKTDSLLQLSETCDFFSYDIETGEESEKVITCIGFTFISIDTVCKQFRCSTVVIPFTDAYNVLVAKRILQSKKPKVSQNGKYDNAYLLRYGIAIRNWAFDTAHLFHSWYSELPKDLGMIALFFLRDWRYWKDEAKHARNDMEYWEYNAKDAFATALSWLAAILEVPDWAWQNYIREFRLVFPCLLTEMTGLKIDEKEQFRLKEQTAASFGKELASIQTMVANPNFNPGSPKQMAALFTILGCEDLLKKSPEDTRKNVGTGKIPTAKAMVRHPLNKRILGRTKGYKEARKLYGSYSAKEITWSGRCLYSLNPHGTDTSRLASKESAFWCGISIHTIPRDKPDIEIKDMFISDPEFYMGEADYAQIDARTTAYLSGDTKLIEAVEDQTKDFHARNAAAFFGIPYEQIVDSRWDEELREWDHSKILNKPIRQTSKNTNHGANYNISPPILVDTMGIDKVWEAKKLLALPSNYTPEMVTGYLLNQYGVTYPVVRNEYQTWVKGEVAGKSMLVIPPGWTRYCFMDPSKNKHALNAYVAHGGQGTTAQILNDAYMEVFYKVWMPNQKDFKLGPQIHDSILFQYRKGYEYLAFRVKQCMESTMPVTDIFGITRNLKVPVDLKGGATQWSKIRKLQQWVC